MKLTPAQIKGSVFRGIVREVGRAGLLEDVMGLVPEEVRSLLREPPLANAWIDVALSDQVGVAIEQVAGVTAWRRISRDAVTNDFIPLVKLAIEGLLRLFGASPATLFSRIGSLAGLGARGIEYSYHPLSDHSGVVGVHIPSLTQVPTASFNGIAGGLEVVFELTRTAGSVGAPDVVAPGRGNSASIRVSW